MIESAPSESQGHPNAASNLEESQDKHSDQLIEDVKTQDQAAMSLDPHGLPLIPQPSRFRDDPLNWSNRLKWAVLLQVSFMAFLGPFNSACPNPSFNLLVQAFHQPVEIITYSTTTAIITGGLSPFILVPLSNVYGRRPICLLCQIITIASHIGTAYTTTFSQLLGARAINGIGFGGMMAMGTPILNDMFFMHERGEKTGLYTIFVTNGAHVAVLIGGILGQRAGWQWDFFMPALVTTASFLVALFFLPETLFSRGPIFLEERQHERTYRQMLLDLRGNMIPQRHLRKQDFFTSFYMLKFPSIAIPFGFYTLSWTFINILPAVSMASIYSSLYGFQSGTIGLCTGIPLIIGCLVGELSGGRLSDYILYRQATRNGGVYRPEYRLYLTCASALAGPVGMIIFGVCLQNRTNYITPLVGLSVGVFGLQVTSTCLYAYVSDCYRPQTPESAILMNLGRGLSFVVGFFWPAMVREIGYAWTWSSLAIVLFVAWTPVVALMVWGERWRLKLGAPSFHQFL